MVFPRCKPGPGVQRSSRLAFAGLALTSAFSQQPRAPSQADLAAASSAMSEGLAAIQRDDLVAARVAFAHAAQLAPQVEAAHAALGSVLLAQGDTQNALQELLHAHALNPGDTSATLNLARCQASLGDLTDALPLFRQALAQPNPPDLSPDETVAFAASLSAAGLNAEAQSQLTHALGQAPDSAILHDAQGSLYASANQIDQALAEFQRASTLDPQLWQAQLHLGVAYLVAEQPQQAIAPLRRAANALPASFDAHLQLGRALSATHDDAEALTELHRAAALRPSTATPETTYALALALEASGDATASIPLFASATATSQLGSAAFTNYALALVQTGNAHDALPLYARALALGPDTPTLREDYGVAFLQQSDLDHAIQQFQAGLALDPASPHLHHDLGLAYKLKDDLAHAVPELQRAAELDPTLPDPAYTLGVIYMQQGKFADAATQLKHATELQPANGDAWALLGGVLKDSDDTPGAVDALQHATALQPDQPSLHIQLAALLVRSGKPEQAVAERKLAADLSRAAVAQQRATFALRSGRTLLAEGKLPEAIVQLNAAVAADPQRAESHTLLAEALDRQGKPAEAALERQRAAALHPAAPTP